MRTVTYNLVSDRQMSVAEAAYMAGFIDGEGTLTIGKERRPGNLSGLRYKPLMTIANTNLEGLERLRATCGNGRIVGNYKVLHLNHRPCYVLQFTPNQIRHLLHQIRPYLVVKAQQADLVQVFVDSIKAGRNATVKGYELAERIRGEVRALNHRGQDPKTPTDPIALRQAKPNRWQQARALAINEADIH